MGLGIMCYAGVKVGGEGLNGQSRPGRGLCGDKRMKIDRIKVQRFGRTVYDSQWVGTVTGELR